LRQQKRERKFLQALKHSQLVIKYSVQTGPFDAKEAEKNHFPRTAALSSTPHVCHSVIDAEFAIKAAGISLNVPGRSNGIFTSERGRRI
jgi:hypothetical protein